MCSLSGPHQHSGSPTWRSLGPRGLPEDAVFEVLAGPHSYTAEMQVKALDWFEDHLGLRAGEWVESVPSFALGAGRP